MTEDADAVRLLLAINEIDPSASERDALVAVYRHTRAQLEKHYALSDTRYEQPSVIFRARLNSPDKSG